MELFYIFLFQLAMTMTKKKHHKSSSYENLLNPYGFHMNSEHKCRLSVNVDDNFSMFLTENYGMAEENLKKY